MSIERRAVYTIDEFERESRYIDTVVWEAIGVEAGSKVLICGYGSEGEAVSRALAAGANVTVIEHRDRAIGQFSHLGAKLLRGSTSVIPAKENAFDLAIAFHYLHEIDPFFHAQVFSELARVGRRVAIVEPAPPGDPLGKRIAVLYSQAKRELGQFEYYQPLEYWKKLMQGVKAEIAQHVFGFSKVPPHEYLVDTIALLIHTIEVEDAPKDLMEELRKIAQRSDAQLLPPPRYVLVGAALGELPAPAFTPHDAFAAPAAPPEPAPQRQPVTTAQETGTTVARDVSPEAGYEFPPIDAPPQKPAAAPAPPPAPTPPSEPAPGFVPGLPLGAPPPAVPAPEGPTPFGAPFAVPAQAEPFGAPPAGIPASTTWQWEPPEGGPPSEGDEAPFGPPRS